MSFIQTYTFKAEVPKAALMAFMAQVPPDYYIFLATGQPLIYGMFISEDVVEYFVNECSVRSFEIIRPEEFRKVKGMKDCRIWGNQELLYL